MAEEPIYTEKELKEMADALLREDAAQAETAKPKRKASKKKEAEVPVKTPEERLAELLERAKRRASSPPRSWNALKI